MNPFKAPRFRTLRRAALALFFSLPLAAPAAAQVSAETAEAWIRMIVDGNYEGAAAEVSAASAAQLNAQSLQSLWGQVTAQTGALEGMTHAPVDGAPEGAVDFEAAFANGPFAVRVVYDAEGRVAGFAVRPPGFFAPAADVSDDQAGKVAAEFVGLLMEARYEDAAAKAGASVKAQMTAAVLENAWESVLNQTGGLDDLGDRTVTREGSMTIVDYAATFGAGPLTVRVVLDGDLGVVGFTVVP